MFNINNNIILVLILLAKRMHVQQISQWFVGGRNSLASRGEGKRKGGWTEIRSRGGQLLQSPNGRDQYTISILHRLISVLWKWDQEWRKLLWSELIRISITNQCQSINQCHSSRDTSRLRKDTAVECMKMFDCSEVSDVIVKRKLNFYRNILIRQYCLFGK